MMTMFFMDEIDFIAHKRAKALLGNRYSRTSSAGVILLCKGYNTPGDDNFQPRYVPTDPADR